MLQCCSMLYALLMESCCVQTAKRWHLSGRCHFSCHHQLGEVWNGRSCQRCTAQCGSTLKSR